jgi:hypothetical protein
MEREWLKRFVSRSDQNCVLPCNSLCSLLAAWQVLDKCLTRGFLVCHDHDLCRKFHSCVCNKVLSFPTFRYDMVVYHCRHVRRVFLFLFFKVGYDVSAYYFTSSHHSGLVWFHRIEFRPGLLLDPFKWIELCHSIRLRFNLTNPRACSFKKNSDQSDLDEQTQINAV